MSVSSLSRTIILIIGEIILGFEKMTSKELYSILASKFTNKLSSISYFEKIFFSIEFDWSNIYNAHLRSFQYKILNSVYFLNKKIVLF